MANERPWRSQVDSRFFLLIEFQFRSVSDWAVIIDDMNRTITVFFCTLMY